MATETQTELDDIDGETLKSDRRYADQCLGQIVQALIEVREEESASKLLSCKMRFEYVDSEWQGCRGICIMITGPVSIIEELNWRGPYRFGEDIETPTNKSRKLLDRYLDLVLGPNFIVRELKFKVEMLNLPENWREELLELARKADTTNQGPPDWSSRSFVQYANLKFRSESEVRIAKALDKSGAMYFANCTARVNKGLDRLNREPDFLICHGGKWGILEVDGEPFHPPTRTVQDHERDRLFEKHGVKFVQHYDASRCYEEANQVVTEFLDLLSRNG